jgi:hypothetical protein
MDFENNDIPRSVWENMIDEWIIGYPNCKRDREILKRRLLDGICFEPLAEEFQMSTRQVKNIVHYTKKILFSHINTKI